MLLLLLLLLLLLRKTVVARAIAVVGIVMILRAAGGWKGAAHPAEACAAGGCAAVAVAAASQETYDRWDGRCGLPRRRRRNPLAALADRSVGSAERSDDRRSCRIEPTLTLALTLILIRRRGGSGG